RRLGLWARGMQGKGSMCGLRPLRDKAGRLQHAPHTAGRSWRNVGRNACFVAFVSNLFAGILVQRMFEPTILLGDRDPSGQSRKGAPTMNTTWRSLEYAAVAAIACMTLSSSPAHAQAFSFGYSGPGVSVGVNTGNYGYFGGAGYYTGGYPLLAPSAFVP